MSQTENAVLTTFCAVGSANTRKGLRGIHPLYFFCIFSQYFRRKDPKIAGRFFLTLKIGAEIHCPRKLFKMANGLFANLNSPAPALLQHIFERS